MLSIRIRTPTSSETYAIDVDLAETNTIRDFRSHLHSHSAPHAPTSPLAAFVHAHALTGRIVFRGRFCANDAERMASLNLETGSVLHLIPHRQLSSANSDSSVAARSSPTLVRTNTHIDASSVASAAAEATASTTAPSVAVGGESHSLTLSVNGVQFTVPVSSSVQVRLPVHTVPLHAEQRTIPPTVMRSTPHENSSSGDHSHHGQQQQQQQQQQPHASISPTASRDVTTSNTNPAAQLSAQLLHAVRESDVAEVRELLGHGASPVLLHGSVTPFHVGALQSDPAIVELLLGQPGVNTELKNRNGETALHYASYHRNAPIQRVLIQAGANLHARTTNGDTPLHLAASVGAVGVVFEQLLTPMSYCPLQSRSVCCLRRASALGLQDSFGRTVLARAIVKGSTQSVSEVLALIPAQGATCACKCAMCIGGGCMNATRTEWRQLLLAIDSFARVCDANLLLCAARHGDANDGTFALVVRSWWKSVCDVMSHDAGRAVLARYLTMLSREQSVCSILKMDTDAIYEKYLSEPTTTSTSTSSSTEQQVESEKASGKEDV